MGREKGGEMKKNKRPIILIKEVLENDDIT